MGYSNLSTRLVEKIQKLCETITYFDMLLIDLVKMCQNVIKLIRFPKQTFCVWKSNINYNKA